MLQKIRMKIRTNILLHFFIVIITFAAVLIGMQYNFNVITPSTNKLNF